MASRGHVCAFLLLVACGDDAGVGPDSGSDSDGGVVIDTCPAAELTPTDGSAGDGFGAAVALTDNRALVGARHAEDVYVFERSDCVWTQVAKLTGEGAPFGAGVGNYLGAAVAIDGDIAILGTPGAGAFSGTTTLYGVGGALI